MKKNKKTAFSSFGIELDRNYFIENLSMLISSGTSIISAFEAIKTEVRSKKMKNVIDIMIGEITTGSPIWRAMDKVSIFPSYMISLVRVGEESGKLSLNLKAIVMEQEKNKAFKSKIKSAIMYPVIVLVIAVVVGIGIAWFILPKLAVVFVQLKLKLPLITKILISVGVFLQNYGLIALPAFLFLFGIVIYFLFIYKKTRFIGQSLLLGMPGVGKLIKEVEIARFGYILGILLEAGLPIVEALKSIGNATNILAFKRLYKHLEKNIEEGNSFQKSFALYPKYRKIFPTSVLHIIVAGEQSGQLSESFKKIGEAFEEKTELSTKNLSVILEPILLIIIWVGIVFIALAVILPIYSLVGGLNKPQ